MGFVYEISIPLWFDWGQVAVALADRHRADFNPTLVRLGRGDEAPVTVEFLHFNPTLVRLGPAGEGGLEEGDSGFQSHFGSIGAPATSCAPWSWSNLSIPLWFDWG